MSVEFFKTDCQNSTDERRFGLYDEEDKTPVKIKFTDENTWNSTVLNNENKEVIVTAIDNCIDIIRQNGEMDNRCDCMLTYGTTLVFIELKNKRDSWQSEGLTQIENVVKIMMKEYPDFYNKFSTRKAIVANRKHQSPSFQVSNIEQRQHFSSKYKMKIQFDAEIVVK